MLPIQIERKDGTIQNKYMYIKDTHNKDLYLYRYHLRSLAQKQSSILFSILLFKTIKFAINSNFVFVNRSKRDFHGKKEEIERNIDRKINFMSTSLDAREILWYNMLVVAVSN